MNNWRLLLLALVAVLQPIASSTERNVFDGRHCCDRQLHSFSHTPNSFADGLFQSAKASPDERRINRIAIREIKQLDTTLSRHSAERFRRQILESATRLRTRYISRNTDNEERLDRKFSERNYRNTRSERDYHQLRIQHIRRTRNIQDVRNNQDSRRNGRDLIIMRIDDTRERNIINRREHSDRNIPRITRHMKTGDRRIVLQNEATDPDIIGSKSVTIGRRIRENVIESRRPASLPNIRISDLKDNRKFRHGHLRVNFNHRQTIVQDLERHDQHRNENRVTKNISIRQNLRNRMSTRSARRNSVLQRATDRSDENSIIPNYEIIRYRDSIMQKRLVTRQGTRKVVLRRTDRELVINQDSELNQRTRTSERRDYRDGSPAAAAKTTRSTESTRDRMRIKYEAKRETTTERGIVGFRNVKATRVRENTYVYQDQKHIENQSNGNWINILYTLQGIYLCGLLMHIINGNGFGKCKLRNLPWWTPYSTSLIKVE